MLHNHYVASWTLDGADEALELRGRVYGQTLECAQKGAAIAAERDLAGLWDGLLERDRSEIDRAMEKAMEVGEELTLYQAFSNEALLMTHLDQDMGVEGAYNLDIPLYDMPKYKAGMACTLGGFVWYLSWDTSEYACSDSPCPFGESPLPRWYESDIQFCSGRISTQASTATSRGGVRTTRSSFTEALMPNAVVMMLVCAVFWILY